MRRDESLEILAYPRHHGGIALRARQQHAPFESRHDEQRESPRIHTLPELPPSFDQQRLQLSRPLIEYFVETLPETLVRIGQLASEIPERRAVPCVPLTLQRDHRVDEERQPVEWLDHRLPQDRQAPLGEA